MNWDQIWYGRDWRAQALAPLSWLTGWVSRRRRREALQRWSEASSPFSVPVVVVGNLTAGGTGKTPLVGHLVTSALKQGVRVGIVSRGYGGMPSAWPRRVTEFSDPQVVGDEPLMLHIQTGAPVVVCTDRVKAVEMLLHTSDVDLVISDDGLQHYALWRDLEILVIDGERQLGNGRLLPAGPLRESPQREETVDWVVERSSSPTAGRMGFQVQAMTLRNVLTQQTLPLHGLNHHPRVDAVAGIGNPEAFFRQLEAAGYVLNRLPLPDHFDYQNSIQHRLTGAPVLMTDKDAVKAGAIGGDETWVVEAQVNAIELTQRWQQYLQQCKRY
ncbi:MAG: tetraacyldisaccharide 4'-kinase [Litorivicinus sp.]